MMIMMVMTMKVMRMILIVMNDFNDTDAVGDDDDDFSKCINIDTQHSCSTTAK
jgi:hypothetical protein